MQTGMRVRETLWFKMGEQAVEPANDEAPVSQLPIEERYADDGTVTASDHAAFSVQTGTTNYLPLIKKKDGEPDPVELASLVGEMKQGRRKIFAVIGASAVVVAAALVVYVS
jgi:hypothetical protein